MEQSEKEALLRQVEIIVHKEVAPVLDILMEYLDTRFDEVDERFLFVFGGITQLIDAALRCPGSARFRRLIGVAFGVKIGLYAPIRAVYEDGAERP